MILPTAGGPYDVTAEIRAGLYVRYRGVDVQNELALMALWLAKNPASLPLKPLRFVENWLKKSQNKGTAAMKCSRNRGHSRVPGLPPAPPHNGGTASPSMAAYGQTAAGSSTSTDPSAPCLPQGTPPAATPLALVNAEGSTRRNGPRTLADALAPFHALVKKHRSQS